ncbi:hypothetical protein BJ138DRAFT_1147315 [Hygrophoropsis aurantiaca]|uniref:Uncharacterized protein n=1 Tax=Hygrophoropsis aurantiaca TaxID=72124 RepID=A0ACB8AHX2_9AGAM|nr:hypothetical protein BJ138DRAFT_1147315 [Hygrophoropsis aurantiaca]
MPSPPFRFLAPASATVSSSPTDNSMDIYSASCNPPRRAKRLRSNSGSLIASPGRYARTHPEAPFLASEVDREDSDDEGQAAPAPAPKRRGRKPAMLSRAAREAQRKVNHSLIEKARRTKINDALSTLRELVPPEYKRSVDSATGHESDEDGADTRKNKGKPKEEKEFKLEILVRTVAYLQDLREKMKELENGTCQRCAEDLQEREVSKCRGRDREVKDALSETPRGSSVASRASTVESTRLPSISAWLPRSGKPANALFPTSSHSPSLQPLLNPMSTHHQLPTPPTSESLPPASTSYPLPPMLTLPSPSTFFRSAGSSSAGLQTSSQHRMDFRSPASKSDSSPVVSPVYSPEDETAASLLLQISTSSPQARFKKPSSSERKGSNEGHFNALTPGKLLGLLDEK